VMLTDSHDDLLAFQLPSSPSPPPPLSTSVNGTASIAFIFAAFVEMREMVDDYSISQTTLEQVFLKLAKETAVQ
jgi:hypothetical protein